MTTAAECIEALDQHLAEGGGDVLLRRYSGFGPTRVPADTPIKSSVRMRRGDDLAGHTDQFDGVAIVSPTGLDPLPTRDDKLVFLGKEYNIEVVKPFLIGTTVVRYELMLTGGV